MRRDTNHPRGLALRNRTLLTAVAIAVAPATALACPVCGVAAGGDSGWAYVAMSVILSALPLAMIGGTTFWVYRRATRQEKTDVPQHPPAVQLRPTRD